jgi:hypothetical protein
MSIGPNSALSELRDEFRASSTSSMPISGTILWTIAALLSVFLPLQTFALVLACGSGLIFPLAMLIDLVRGRNLMAGNKANPVLSNFMQGIATIALLWPLVIIAGLSNPIIIVLGAAILMALVWIPYGWSADDPVGLQHAIGRCVAAYAAYIFVPADWRATAICLVVIAAYAYSFVRIRRN